MRPNLDALARVGYYKLSMPSTPSAKHLHKIYRIIIFFFVLLYNLQHLVQAIRVRKSTELLVNTLFVLLTTLNAFGKQLIFILKAPRIDRLLETIDGPIFKSICKYHDELLLKNATRMMNLLKISHAAIVTCGTLWGILPLVKRYIDGNFQFAAYFPFVVDSSPTFELCVVYLTASITLQAYGHVTMDCTIVALYNQAKTQLEMLNYQLINLVRFDETEKPTYVDPESSEDALKQRFVCAVKRYEEVVRFVKEIVSIFREALIFHLLVMSWVICMSLYKMVGVKLLSTEFLAVLVYLVIMLVQLFMFCYVGTDLQLMSETVSPSIFACDWPSIPTSFRRKLIIMALCCSKPLILKAGIIPMSLQTYLSVLRMSYTLFTILDRK